MTSNARGTTQRIVTLVVRMWPEGSRDGASSGFRCEATHVQSGQVVYFREMEELVLYLNRLSSNAG